MLSHQIGRSLDVVGISGNIRRPSKTHLLVAEVLQTISERYGVEGRHLDLSDALPDLGLTYEPGSLGHGGLAKVVAAIEGADVLVVGSPVYNGAYSGLFKHLFDLIGPLALRAKPVIVTAVGGGRRHALVVEQSLRPLFGFFTAYVMPTAIYASSEDFDGGGVASEDVAKRIHDAVGELGPLITRQAITRARRIQPEPSEHLFEGAFDRVFA